MKSDVQVLVIGGGIVGTSVLYWLAKKGWTDSALVERRELTSGATWHAAGNTTYFGPYAKMTQLFAGSIRTYLAAEEHSGQSVGFHQTGSLRVATTEHERALFNSYQARYDALNIPYSVVENDTIRNLHPCIETDDLFGAAHTPTDGHVDPSGATQALAKSARLRGAHIERWCPAVGLAQESDGSWLVETEKGDIRAKHVVLAASFWTRELAQPLGLNIPLYATQHHEVITGAVPELQALKHEVPAMRDSYVSCSVRQEKHGFLAGFYEDDPVFWALDGIPKDFTEELFAPDTDRLTTAFERLMERLPAFAEAGIQTVNNGPMCWTPDGLPLLGPVNRHPGLWLASGFNVGIGTGGGSAEFLAHWMIHGEPLFNLPIVHADRFGNDLSTEAAIESIKACYRQGYRLPQSI